MARRRLITMVLSGALALAASLTTLTGAVLAAQPTTAAPGATSNACGHFEFVNVTAGITAAQVTSLPPGSYDQWYDSLTVGTDGPYALAPGDYWYTFGGQGSNFYGDFTVQPCSSASPSVGSSQPASSAPTFSSSPSSSATAIATSCLPVLTVVPNAPAQSFCPSDPPSPFQSFQGETAGVVSPAPTSTETGSSGGDFGPPFGILIALFMGGLGLMAIAARRQAIRRW